MGPRSSQLRLPRGGAVERDSAAVTGTIVAANSGETILVVKDGKPWARPMPMESDQSRRHPGVLGGSCNFPPSMSFSLLGPPRR
jgi:hypothetical protein